MSSRLFGKAAPSNEIDGPYESFLTPLVIAERGGWEKPCDVIQCFHGTCGHIETKTSCHNYMGNIVTQPDRGIILPPPAGYPCKKSICDQSVVTTLCLPGNCLRCQTRDDLTDPMRISFDNDLTIACSDPDMATIPPTEIETRSAHYRQLMSATQARHRELSRRYDPHKLLFSDFATNRFDRSARDFIEHYRQLRRHPGVVDPKQFYAELRKRRAEEDRRNIPPEDRQYFSGSKFDETDLMRRVQLTDKRIPGEECMICQEGFVPDARGSIRPIGFARAVTGGIGSWLCRDLYRRHEMPRMKGRLSEG
ncbi:hypothetical protein VE03_08467 [Pseudogymnoascus sp. 23342-1-I1]|nr:hypothetical protein VE03_08467 [Pseudogymnoascus sp. 23342-1-I1]